MPAVPAPAAAPTPSSSRRFVAQVRAPRAAARESEHFSLSGVPLRTAPGTLGDPFRVVSLLPGVSSPLPGLPIYAIRGASPGTSGFFLDGMRLPQLFHLLIGGAVVYANLVEQVDFFPSGYDAAIGRLAGGAISATTRPAREDGQHAELAVRLYDVSGLVELKLPHDVRLTVSGHYGYPGPILQAVEDRIRLSYWDYQLRLDYHGLTVQALGSYDSLEIKNPEGSLYVSAQNSRLMFHRLQVRERLRRGPVQVEAALYGGYDEAGDVAGRGVRKLALGWRGIVQARWSRFKLQGGVDGELAQFDGQRFDLGLRNLAFVRDAEGPARVSGKDPDRTPDELGDLGRPRTGVTNSLWLQGSVELYPKRATLTVGGRLDVYHASGVTLLGVDPRVQLDLVLQPWLRMHIGGGVYQQPPSFPLLLPGIDTFALQLGLQRATGGSVTEELKLPADLTLSATGFYQLFTNVTDPSAAVTEGLAFVLETLPVTPYLGLLLMPAHTNRFLPAITSEQARHFGRSMLDRFEVDWAAYGYDDSALDELVEFVLRTVQSFVTDPGQPPRDGADLRRYLARWVGSAVAAQPIQR